MAAVTSKKNVDLKNGFLRIVFWRLTTICSRPRQPLYNNDKTGWASDKQKHSENHNVFFFASKWKMKFRSISNQ
jgi:hypothetical protein